MVTQKPQVVEILGTGQRFGLTDALSESVPGYDLLDCGEWIPTIPIFLSRFAPSIRVIGRVPNFRLLPTATSFRHH